MQLRLAHEHRVDAVLFGGIAEAAFTHVEPLRMGRQIAQARIRQRVEQHNLRSTEGARAPHRDQIGGTGAGRDESDVAHSVFLQRTSKAPLVRLLVGSTTIRLPPTRFCA